MLHYVKQYNFYAFIGEYVFAEMSSKFSRDFIEVGEDE